jgi:ribonucleoside-diphosphate reductase alpha chain
MVQSKTPQHNALHELGYKIFLDRYAQKDMTRKTLSVGDTVIVVVDSKTGQREIGTVKAIQLPKVTIQLLDGEMAERDVENVDKPLETDPGQMMDRVAAGIAATEKNAKLRKTWAQRFRWLLDDWKFVPAGRILTAAGTDQKLTYYNCMPPDQEILTANGYRPIGEVRVGDLVVTHRNRLRPVLHKFERDTEEAVYVISPKKIGFDDLRVTGDHKIHIIRSEWLNPKHRSRDGIRLQQPPDWIPAKEVRVGDFVALAHNAEECPPEPIFLQDYLRDSGYQSQDGRLFKPTTRGEQGQVKAWGTHFAPNERLELDGDLCYLFGRWLGDGCITHRTGTDIPSGIKIVFNLQERAEAEQIAQIIEQKFGVEAAIKLSSTERWYDLWVNSMPIGQFFKAFLGCYSHSKFIADPLMHMPEALTRALLRGLFSADGYISGNHLGILLANRRMAVQVHQLLLRMGYVFSIKENTHRLGRTPAYRISATANECGALFKDFFDEEALPLPATDLKYYFEYDGLKWVRIDEIGLEDYSGAVVDIEVAEDHSFVSAGVVVSNCYVIPSPRDSRNGIIETLRQMTEIMSRGGGVGINISSLRPRHSYVKGVNGRSSGSVSWGALYSFVTGLIEQGGCFGPNERIFTDKGLIPAAELADRMDAGEIFHAQTHRGMRQVTARFRNGVKPLYEVTTERGYTVRITEDHKVAVLMDGKITTMALKYLQPGDEILLLLGDGVQADYVRLQQQPYERSIMSTTLNEDVRLPDVLNEELAYLLGYMHGDGYVVNGKKVNWSAPKGVKLATAHAYPAIEERLVRAIQNQFGLTATIEPADYAMNNVALYSRVVVDWLQQNGLLKAHADQIRVPEAIFRSPSAVAGAFLAGYFDADGCDRGRKGGYGFDCIHRPMLADVQQLLSANGIVSRLSKTDRSAQNWQDIYRLSVTGAQFKQRFAAFVPAEKVDEAQGTRTMYQTYPADVWATTGERAKYRQHIYDGVSERISYNQITHIQERLHAAGRVESANHLSDLLRTLPDTIQSIQPLGDSDVYDFEVDEVHLLSGAGIYTSNSRRGALMLILNDWHPDVFDFINSKRKAGQITNANISVGVSDKLMEQVKVDGDWPLMFPDTSDPVYDELWDGDLDKWVADGHKAITYRTVKARAVWDAIIESAWASAEPGVFFRERYNKMSNSWYYAPIISTNPCGEQGLPAFGVCNLGAINLAKFYDADKHDVAWGELDRAARYATRFLDNVIDSTPYFFDENHKQQTGERRVGLNNMGLAELMIRLGIRYGSDESVAFIDKLYGFLARSIYETSVELAQEKGAFPNFDAEKFGQSGFMQSMPQDIQEMVRKNGIRNVTLTTQAPTGTTGTMVNTSTGIEPFFSWVYYRKSRLGLHEEQVPLVKEWRDQNPGAKDLPDYFVTAMDLSPEDHVKVQGAIQRWVDSSISKTCNVPNHYTVEQVSDLYKYMYELGCKGGTIYRDGSRDEQVLMLKGDERAEGEKANPAPKSAEKVEQVATPHHVYPRPKRLSGVTVSRKTPFGTAYITMNSDEYANPFEVFITVGKAGSDLQADAEGLGRMISLQLRTTAPQNRMEMLKLIVDQLQGIGGSRSVGMGPSRVISLPDAVAGALTEHYLSQQQPQQLGLGLSLENGNGSSTAKAAHADDHASSSNGAHSGYITGADLCPSCGTVSLVKIEGCEKCMTCDYSRC